TPAAVGRLLKEELARNKRCRLCVIANEENPEGTVAGILGASDIVVASGESISMVSEAMCAEKNVVVFFPEKKHRRVTKHESAIRRYASDGLIRVAETKNVGSAIADLYAKKAAPAKIDDMSAIYKAMRHLI
ncbi:MAG: ELM1/GtrOC1 family putative glycosyltransferase, partial [Candidatus Omnitrophota bacterium]